MRRFAKLGTLLLAICSAGCLPSDPGTKGSDSSSNSSRNGLGQHTRAPKKIAPNILQTRAFKEAPMLTERVRSGDLPPVSERLPENPVVIVPMEEIGTYGGTLRRALTGDIAQTPGVSKTLNENLMGYERPLPKSILYNLAEHYEFQDNGKTAVFKIRKGIKWSDGAPFTVDDILFWYNDVTRNDEARASPLFPSAWLVEGKQIEMDKMDDLTLRVRSHKPLGRLLNLLCGDWIAFPKHVLKDLHPIYNPEADYQTFKDSTTTAQMLYNPKYPRLSAWHPVEWTRGQRIIYERNPYYFKVDSAGNQLPYTDRLQFTIIQDTQVLLLKFINGEIDLLGRYAQVSMFSTLKSEEGRGIFKIHLGVPAVVSTFRPNWDAPRPELAEAFRDLRVRKALSFAINREEINQILYHGLLEPASYSFGPASQYYSEEAAQMYSKFDPDEARRLLDEAGYTDRDKDGIREFKNGEAFRFTIDVIPGMGVDICQLAADHWRKIGIAVDLNIALRDIVFPRWSSGEFDMWWWWAWSDDPVVDRGDWGMMGPNLPGWHRTAKQQGPAWLHEVTKLVEEAGTSVDTARVNRNFRRVRDLHSENIPVIIPGFAYHLWGSNTRLGNVPDEGMVANAYRGWSRPVFHEQIFVRTQ